MGTMPHGHSTHTLQVINQKPLITVGLRKAASTADHLSKIKILIVKNISYSLIARVIKLISITKASHHLVYIH